MIYFVENWSPKESWLNLSTEQKASYTEQVLRATNQLQESGIKLLTWSINKSDIPHSTPHNYFAIWSIPSQEMADILLAAITTAGWYNYFDQINTIGTIDSPENVLKRMTNHSTINIKSFTN